MRSNNRCDGRGNSKVVHPWMYPYGSQSHGRTWAMREDARPSQRLCWLECGEQGLLSTLQVASMASEHTGWTGQQSAEVPLRLTWERGHRRGRGGPGCIRCTGAGRVSPGSRALSTKPESMFSSSVRNQARQPADGSLSDKYQVYGSWRVHWTLVVSWWVGVTQGTVWSHVNLDSLYFFGTRVLGAQGKV